MGKWVSRMVITGILLAMILYFGTELLIVIQEGNQ